LDASLKSPERTDANQGVFNWTGEGELPSATEIKNREGNRWEKSLTIELKKKFHYKEGTGLIFERIVESPHFKPKLDAQEG